MSTTHGFTRRAFGWHSQPAKHYNFREMAPLIFCLFFFWPFGGGRKTKMIAGDKTPAAHGTVTVKTGSNGNARVTVNVKDLAQPDALTPPEHTYVVWVQPPGKSPRNIGALQVDKNLTGQLSTDTPFHAFKIFITAENYPQITAPQGPRVLSAQVSK
jgi:hypothetical protein